KSGLQFLQGKAELLAKFVHDEKPLPVVFLADTTRSEDRLLVPSFSSPAPRALPPGAFTARATRPFNSYPHDPPQSGNAPVLLTHMAASAAAPPALACGCGLPPCSLAKQAAAEQGREHQRHNGHQLDQDVEGRAGGILEGVAHRKIGRASCRERV